MMQHLISKDDVARELKRKEVTLREVFQYCQSNGLRFIAEDKYFFIAEPSWLQDEMIDRIRCALDSLLTEVHTVSKHFREY